MSSDEVRNNKSPTYRDSLTFSHLSAYNLVPFIPYQHIQNFKMKHKLREASQNPKGKILLFLGEIPPPPFPALAGKWNNPSPPDRNCPEEQIWGPSSPNPSTPQQNNSAFVVLKLEIYQINNSTLTAASAFLLIFI